MSILSRRGEQRCSPFLFSQRLRRQIGTLSTMARIQLQDLEDAFGGDLQSLIAGRDMEADRRQRNREFVSSGKYWDGKRYRFVSSIPQPPISSLVLP